MKKSILSVFLFFASISLFAESIQSTKILTRKIEQYVLNELASYKEGKVRVTADKIDSRLNLNACTEDHLVVFNPYQSSMLETSTMGIKCQEKENHWSLYVPIRITILKTVFLAKRSLMAGEQITGNDLYQAEINIHQLKHGYFNDIDDLIGRVCSKNVAINTPFNPHNIELAKVVHKGEKVSIVTNNNNLTISMDGIALSGGTVGDTIKVKNLSSNKIVEAQIAGEKRVSVVF